MTPYHYIVAAIFFGFALAELVARGRSFPNVAFWRVMGVVSAILYFVIAALVPPLWDEWLGAYRLFDLTALPLWAQVVIGFVVLEFGIYWWHRAMHSFDPLWRATHQMHHSAERVDIWGAYYFHPLDMAGWALLGSLCLVWVVGMSADAAFVVGVITTFPAIFQHANIRTPHWLGYLLQRPESHSVHHERGVHAYNYGDIPVFDMLFGTFRNPPDWQGNAGFHPGSTTQVGDMLRFRKIS